MIQSYKVKCSLARSTFEQWNIQMVTLDRRFQFCSQQLLSEVRANKGRSNSINKTEVNKLIIIYQKRFNFAVVCMAIMACCMHLLYSLSCLFFMVVISRFHVIICLVISTKHCHRKTRIVNREKSTPDRSPDGFYTMLLI